MRLGRGQQAAVSAASSMTQDGPAVVWARHTPTQWNRAGRLQGRIDIDVDDGAVADAMTPLTFQLDGVALVWSSPLMRARRSAAFVAGVLGLDHCVDECLAELAFGPFEGQCLEELTESDRTKLLEWMRQPFATPPPWEPPWSNPEAGIRIFLERLDAPVAVIGHTVNSRWLEHLCGRIGVPFTRITVAAATSDVSRLL
jgi:broad specificity phosphatase PhoE